MATIPSTTLIKLNAGGDPVKVATWILRDISNGDIIDTSEEFSTVRGGVIMTIANLPLGGVCTVLTGTTLGVPAVGAHDFGWLTAWGSAK